MVSQKNIHQRTGRFDMLIIDGTETALCRRLRKTKIEPTTTSLTYNYESATMLLRVAPDELRLHQHVYPS